MKGVVCILACLLSTSYGYTQPIPQPIDLIVNGDFEEGLAGWSWRLSELSNEGLHGGLCATGEAPLRYMSRSIVTLSPLGITPGVSYDLSWQSRGGEGTRIQAKLVGRVSEATPIIDLVPGGSPCTATWAVQKVRFIAPPHGPWYLQLVIPSSWLGLPGRVWIDNISLTEVVEGKTTSATSTSSFSPSLRQSIIQVGSSVTPTVKLDWSVVPGRVPSQGTVSKRVRLNNLSSETLTIVEAKSNGQEMSDLLGKEVLSGGIITSDVEWTVNGEGQSVADIVVVVSDGNGNQTKAATEVFVDVEAPSPPHIVFVLIDDLGRECLSRNGSSYSTPNIDRLAEQGAYFSHYVTQPICTPTRAQIMTGYRNYRNYRYFREVRRNEVLLPRLLKEAGYATVFTGKWQMDDYEGPMPDDPEVAIDAFSAWNFSQEDLMRDPRYINGHYLQKDVLTGLRVRGRSGSVHGDDLHYGYAIGEIEKYVAAGERVAWFMWMMLPHEPWQRTPAHPEWNLPGLDMLQENKNFFPSMVQRVDELVGRIDADLGRLGIRNDTLMLIAADNGTDYRLSVPQRDGTTIQGRKHYLLNYGTNVPLIAYWPGHIAPGQVIASPVESDDLFATCVDVGRAILPDPMPHGPIDGMSILPLLGLRDGPVRDIAVIDFEGGANRGSQDVGYEGVFAQDGNGYKLYGVSMDGDGMYRSGNLYNIDDDPFELNPIPIGSSTEADVARSNLQQALDSR